MTFEESCLSFFPPSPQSISSLHFPSFRLGYMYDTSVIGTVTGLNLLKGTQVSEKVQSILPWEILRCMCSLK